MFLLLVFFPPSQRFSTFWNKLIVNDYLIIYL